MRRWFPVCAIAATLFRPVVFVQAGTFRIASYNLEGYLDEPTTTRPAKTAESKAAIRASIHAARPDALAVQEIGSVKALLELRDTLKAEGLDLPHWEHVSGFDTNIHVAVLSKFPITDRRPHTNENFLLSGRRFQVSRGFAEVDLQITSGYSLTLIAAHLKSKRPIPTADETELRHQEARLLREKIDARLAANPEINLLVLGDLNDTHDAASTRLIIGRGRLKLTDTRPAERDGVAANESHPGGEPRNISWTHFYPKEDSYTRIDYILLSPGLSREWVKKETWIVTLPNWGIASDHRPIVATFEDADR